MTTLANNNFCKVVVLQAMMHSVLNLQTQTFSLHFIQVRVVQNVFLFNMVTPIDI